MAHHLRLNCMHCAGEGRIFKSKYGGNDPDVWDAGKCLSCAGSGNQVCEHRSCDEDAVGFNDDGEAMCADCLMQWTMENAE
jgi:hypothetical protein